MLAPLARGAALFVHRDYFAGNLMWLPERAGRRRVGILDFQGAAIGHAAYDLASLIQDDRRDLPEAVRSGPWRGSSLRARRSIPRPSGRRRDLRGPAPSAGAGQWVRLARRDGKPHYLAHGPRTWRLLEEALPNLRRCRWPRCCAWISAGSGGAIRRTSPGTPHEHPRVPRWCSPPGSAPGCGR